MTAALSCPRRWGDYLLVSPLGVGGMGVVYLAQAGAAERERLCVVKMLQADAPSEPERLQRFRREADIVRNLSHGAIAQTLAIDEVEGSLCIVQEYIQGRNLTQIGSAARSVAPGRIPLVLSVHIVREVARALAYAHHGGIVHRDVAPQNVMVAFSGEVKLIDFGVARLADASDASLALTRPGQFLGRIVYTAPEVLEGARADRRADVYSAGVLLWELLTGQLPLFGDILPRRAPPAPSTFQPDVPRDVDTAVLKALEPDPAQRFDSAEDLQRALGPCLPVTFAGEPELRQFLARCYDVQADERRLHEQVADAHQVVSQGTASTTLESSDAPITPRRASWPTRVAVGFCVAAVAGGAAVLVRARPRISPPTPVELTNSDRPVVQGVTVKAQPAPARSIETAAPTASGNSTRAANARAGSTRRATRPPVVGPSAGVLLDRALDSLQAGDLEIADRNARGVLVGTATTLEKAGAHVILGKVFVLRSQPHDAASEFSAAIELDPANEAATAALARLRRRGQL